MTPYSAEALASPETALTQRQKMLALVGVLVSMLLAALDQTIVATAGPAIQVSLKIPAALYAWITTSYMVASTVLVPIYGKLSDLYGRRPILVVGVLLFLAGSLLCGVSNDAVTLIAARAVQGLGSAALFTTAFAVVADLFAPADCGRYNGLFGAVFGLASVVGPLAGGFITDHFGWHWVFFINLPIGAVALGFIFTKMPPLGGWRGTGERPRVDVAGALTLILGVVPLLVALSLGKSPLDTGRFGFPWSSWQILTLFGVAIVGLGVFAVVENRSAAPLLDLRLFRNVAFARGVASTFVTGNAFLAGIVFLPLFMVKVVGLSATSSGLTVMPLTMGLIAGNVASGQLVSRLGYYKRLILGALGILVGAYAVMGWTLTASSTQAEVTLKMIFVGFGLGPSIPILTLAIQNAVAPQQIGVATSASTFFRQMGSTTGVAILGSVFGASLATSMHDHMVAAVGGGHADPAGMMLASKQAFTDAISLLFRIAAGISALAFVVTLRLPELPLRRAGQPAQAVVATPPTVAEV